MWPVRSAHDGQARLSFLKTCTGLAGTIAQHSAAALSVVRKAHDEGNHLNDMAKNLILWVVIALVLLAVFNRFAGVQGPVRKVTYSDFVTQVEDHRISQVMIDGYTLTGLYTNNEKFEVNLPPTIRDDKTDGPAAARWCPGRGPADRKAEHLVAAADRQLSDSCDYRGFCLFHAPDAGRCAARVGPMGFGKSKARLLSEDQIKTTFGDVAGIDEAKEDVRELVDFLKDPGKFQRLGGRIPRGVLMVGSPGTGKTLLAKAIAGEARVPFFTISGSDFVEMFVGVGASRCAGHVRAGQETGALHYFHRRD